jgi:hypothetical protein
VVQEEAEVLEEAVLAIRVLLAALVVGLLGKVITVQQASHQVITP